MKARCPKNETHKRFITVAHVTEDWVVDEKGNFIEVCDETCGETTHGPDPENTWQCAICFAEAIVVANQQEDDSEKIRKLYENGECPDCGDTIPPTMVDGGECENCGHVFYAELLENDDQRE